MPKFANKESDKKAAKTFKKGIEGEVKKRKAKTVLNTAIKTEVNNRSKAIGKTMNLGPTDA